MIMTNCLTTAILVNLGPYSIFYLHIYILSVSLLCVRHFSVDTNGNECESRVRKAHDKHIKFHIATANSLIMVYRLAC